jgi:hypothetical protein
MNKELKTYWAKIYIAGSSFVIQRVCRDYCDKVGLCVTITATKFVYTMGQEDGFEIGLINYPRFPTTEDDVLVRAKELAELLRRDANQRSYLIQTPYETIYGTATESHKL